jgi:hypothetical protein
MRKEAAHSAGEDVVYWIAPENGAKKSAGPRLPQNHGFVTQAFAENATRITKQTPMEQKKCGFASSK